MRSQKKLPEKNGKVNKKSKKAFKTSKGESPSESVRTIGSVKWSRKILCGK